jgi:hypothetical protein
VRWARLLWVGKDRTMHSFEKFFKLIGQELAGKIEFVCSDTLVLAQATGESRPTSRAAFSTCSAAMQRPAR